MSLSRLGMCVLALFVTVRVFASPDPVPGFEKPEIMEAVMGGQIHTEEMTTGSKKEFRTVFRAFFNKTSPEAYAALATNHAKYPELFSDIKQAKTTKVNADHTEFEYWMDVIYKFGPFQQHFYPEGRQVFTKGKDAASEAKLVHNITNYKDFLQLTEQVTRLIPYQTGMLVHDDIHVILVKDSSQSTMIKTKLNEQFKRYLTVFREHLGGDR